MIGIRYCKRENRPDIKIPILLYHDFVKEVPETDTFSTSILLKALKKISKHYKIKDIPFSPSMN